mgnify:CR=1 FL=1
MFFSSLRKNNSFARKAVALLVLCGVLLATAPVPIGWKPKGPAGSEPFPCQDCHCGCLTAEQCWTSCCCYTPEERLAWATENGIEPPSYAVLVSKTERLVANSKAVVKKACCHHSGLSEAVQEPDQPETVVVLSISAMKCRGLGSLFNLLPWATIHEHSISCIFPEPIATPFEVRDEWLPSSNSQPDAPPPRFSAGCA